MIVSLSQEFGVPLNLDDHAEDTNSEVTRTEQGSPDPELTVAEEEGRHLTTSRMWTPLETRNPVYEKLISQRRDTSEQPTDFIKENIVSIISIKDLCFHLVVD